MPHINIEDKIEIVSDKISAIENYTREINQDIAMGLIAEDQIEPTDRILSDNRMVLVKLNEILTNMLEML